MICHSRENQENYLKNHGQILDLHRPSRRPLAPEAAPGRHRRAPTLGVEVEASGVALRVAAGVMCCISRLDVVRLPKERGRIGCWWKKICKGPTCVYFLHVGLCRYKL